MMEINSLFNYKFKIKIKFKFAISHHTILKQCLFYLHSPLLLLVPPRFMVSESYLQILTNNVSKCNDSNIASETLQAAGKGEVGVYPVAPTPGSKSNPVEFQDLIAKVLPLNAEKLGREGNNVEVQDFAPKFLRSNNLKPVEGAAMKTEACLSPNALVRGR